MQNALVMTVIGQDRPGLVESVAAMVTEHGGNWLDSRMSRLGGQFAGILRVEVPPENQAPLIKALEALQTRGLSVMIQPDTAAAPAAPSRLHSLELVGQDRPGIIRQISGALAQYGIKVEELQSECSSAAMSGETLFKARARISLPAGCQIDEVRRRLEKIAEDLIVEISLAEVK